jgi:hypothetical protein
MDSISATAVLTAMITPAVLISACGSMILSTSSRLGRVVDLFVATSVAIGIVALADKPRYTMVPVIFGIAGAGFSYLKRGWRSAPFMRDGLRLAPD